MEDAGSERRQAAPGLLRVALWNVAILALGVTLVELVFGAWLHPSPLNRLHIIKSAAIQFDVTGLYDAPYATVRYTRDANGLRGSFRDPSDIDLLTVGGSTTDQRYIADGETWQDVLGRKFLASNNKIVVANAGVDGQSTFGHLKNFSWWFPHIRGLKPKYILFYVGLNDFYKDEGDLFDALEKHNLFTERSAIYFLCRTLWGIYQAKVRKKIEHAAFDLSKIPYTRTPLRGDHDRLMQARLEAYRARLVLLIEETRRLGAVPIFVTQPSRRYRVTSGGVEGIAMTSRYDSVEINGVDYFFMMKRLNAVTISTCEAHGGICLDMANAEIWEDRDFYDFEHMTPGGAAKVGGYLFEHLKGRLGNAVRSAARDVARAGVC
jgi:hypothetical protein